MYYCIICIVQLSQYETTMEIRNSITREEVFLAASELFAQGTNPTQTRVREKLGRGSYSTIHKHLQEWKKVGKDVENANLNTNPTEPIPDDIHKKAFLLFNRLLSEVWTEGTIKAEENKVNAMVATLETENQELRNKLVDYEKMQGRLEVLEGQVERLGKLEQTIQNMVNEKSHSTSQSTNNHVIELSSSDWRYGVNPSDD